VATVTADPPLTHTFGGALTTARPILHSGVYGCVLR